MNKARLSYGKDAAVTIEISDEACRRCFLCEELADQDRFEDLHCEDCPLGLEIGGLCLCEIQQVQDLIEMRMKQLDEKGENE